jgi:hypothetical protein
MMDLIWRGVVLGVGATILMDLWAILLALVLGEPKANWAPVGRWFYHAGRGQLFHESISDAAPFANENALGWIGHYAVGIVYGVMLAMFMGSGWLAAPTLAPALVWGVVTVAAGWFLLQPGLGLGIAASRLPRPNRVRALNLAAHVVFGLGLYATALLIR